MARLARATRGFPRGMYHKLVVLDFNKAEVRFFDVPPNVNMEDFIERKGINTNMAQWMKAKSIKVRKG